MSAAQIGIWEDDLMYLWHQNLPQSILLLSLQLELLSVLFALADVGDNGLVAVLPTTLLASCQVKAHSIKQA